MKDIKQQTPFIRTTHGTQSTQKAEFSFSHEHLNSHVGCRGRLVLEGKAGRELPELKGLQFIDKNSANSEKHLLYHM